MHPQIDDATFRFLVYILGITFSGLVGIIVFLAKNLNSNVKIIKENQDKSAIEMAQTKKDVDNLMGNCLQQVRTNTANIQSAKEEVYKNAYTISNLERTVEELRNKIRDIEKDIDNLK